MPAPSSYIDISSVPFSRVVTQAEFNASNEIWFRFVTASTIVLGGYCNTGGTFTPTTQVYESDGTTVVDAAITSNKGWWRPLEAGTYYIKITRTGSGASDFDFTAQFNTAAVNPTSIPEGSIFVNDDNEYDTVNTAYPAYVMESDGTIIGFFPDAPAGEMGCALPNGKVLLHDRFGMYASGSVVLLDASLRHEATLTPSPALVGFPYIFEDGTYFYVVDNDTGNIYRVDASAGTISASLGTVPFPVSPNGMGMSRDANIFYWTQFNDDKIFAYNLSANTTSTLYTVPGFVVGFDTLTITPNGHPGEILVLPNGNIVFWWKDDSVPKYQLVEINSAGVLQTTKDFADPIGIDHICLVSDSLSTQIKIWLFPDGVGDYGTFATLTLATGVLSDSVDKDLFGNAINFQTGTEVMFGPSNSCFMAVLLGGITVSDDHIFIMTDRRNDNGEAIPTPYFITALLGD